MDRIEQGITALDWTQALAFLYFPNALRSNADDWMKCVLFGYPEIDQTWTTFKPLFCKKFDVVSIANMFNRIAKLTLASCKNNLDNYYCMVCQAIQGEKDQFLCPVVKYPDGDAFQDVHRAFVLATLGRHTTLIYEKLKAECFINGLPQTDFDRLKNKARMTTANEMYKFLVKDRAFKNASADRSPIAVTPIEWPQR